VSLDDITIISKPLLTNIAFIKSSCRDIIKLILLGLLYLRSYIVITHNEETLIKFGILISVMVI